MSSKINFAQFPREPLTAKSAPLHKGAIEYTFRVPKQSTSSHKSTNDDAPRALKRQERALSRQRDPGTIGEQDSTGHDAGLRTSKSYSPSEEPSSMILRGYCGAKGSKDSGPFHIKPKAHAEKEELPEDE